MKYPFICNLNKYLKYIILLFAFITIIDPPGTYLHLKDPLFILLLLSCIVFKKPNYYCLIPFILCIIIWQISSIIGYLTNEIKDFSFNFGILKSLFPFIILGWIKNLNFTKALTKPCCVISLISITVVIAMTYYPKLEIILYNYFTIENGLMMIGRRNFLGIDVASAFYRSTPLIIFPLTVYAEKYLLRKKKNIFYISLILFLGLLSGGNRACMLSAIGIIITVYLVKLYNDKKFKSLLIFIFIFFSSSLIILFLLLTENKEASNVAKFGHLVSYIDLFNNYPQIIFLGQGPGALFYTKGFNENAVQTEWSYIELIRYFGIFGGLIIIGIFIYPIFRIIKHRNLYINNGLSLIIGNLFYLILAGTNPLLLGSTGLLACLYSYSYIYYGKK